MCGAFRKAQGTVGQDPQEPSHDVHPYQDAEQGTLTEAFPGPGSCSLATRRPTSPRSEDLLWCFFAIVLI